MDRGAPYRSIVGLPGGSESPLYATLAAQNQHGMELKTGVGGLHGDGDVANTVWVVDSNRFPFYAGEMYHQFHCNFFSSPGMPYPDSYVLELFKDMKDAGRIKPTGCPEDGRHVSCLNMWGR